MAGANPLPCLQTRNGHLSDGRSGYLMSLFVIIATLMSYGAASAHEQKVAITQILFNPVTGNIEVSHRLYLHDAEHAVQDYWGKADLLSDEEDLKKLALYTRGNFSISFDGSAVSLTPVGVEVEGPFVWVYDEAPIPDTPVESVTISNFVLRDVWRSQSNLVNLEIGKFRKSEFFSGDDTEKTISIELPSQASIPSANSASQINK